MANIIQRYLRSRAHVAAKRGARGAFVVGKTGGYFRPDSEAARAILERLLVKHYQGGSRPTCARLPADQIRLFPGLSASECPTGYGWMCLVTDEAGRSAYGISTEVDALDRGTAVTMAKARAQQKACEVLAGYMLADLKGGVGELLN